MAIAQTPTWLPLDTWAKLMGYNPWLFNGFSQFPNTIGDECSDVWVQSPGQYSTLSREELATAIKEAENMISNYLGYNLLPDWGSELVYPPRFNVPPYSSPTNTYGRPKSVRVDQKYLIQLGIMVRNYLETVTIVPMDLDNDGFNETGQVTIAETTLDPNQVRLFYPDADGDAGYEIRPVKSLGSGVYQFPMYLVPLLELIERPVIDPIDPADSANYLVDVAVYQVYNDVTTPVTLVYDTSDCSECVESSVAGCATIENEKLGYVRYNPSNILASCRYDPDKVRINWLAGWRSNRGRWLQDLDQYWHTAVAYLAPNFFPYPVKSCCGGEQAARVSEWASDIRQINNPDALRGGVVTPTIVENPFGLMTKGAWYAFNKCRTKRV